MVTKAYILIETEVDKTAAVVKAIKKLDEVKFVHSVTGPFDIIAYLEAEDSQVIGRIILEKIRTLPGMKHTLTCIVTD